MSEEDLDRLEAMEAVALDGPWRSGHNDMPDPPFIVCESRNSSAVAYVRFPTDARLIAALRTHAKELIELARIGLELRQ